MEILNTIALFHVGCFLIGFTTSIVTGLFILNDIGFKSNGPYDKTKLCLFVYIINILIILALLGIITLISILLYAVILTHIKHINKKINSVFLKQENIMILRRNQIELINIANKLGFKSDIAKKLAKLKAYNSSDKLFSMWISEFNYYILIKFKANIITEIRKEPFTGRKLYTFSLYDIEDHTELIKITDVPDYNRTENLIAIYKELITIYK